ncbi:endonuclease dU [Thermococcus sp.]
MIRKVKNQIRVVGFDDGTFRFKGRGRTILIGVVMKGSQDVVGVLSRWITVDGRDATDKMIDSILSSRFEDLRVIMLKGITYAGFNIVDIQRLSRETGLPVVVVIRKKPDQKAMEDALRKHFPDWRERIELLKKAGEIFEMIPGRLYYQAVNIPPEQAEEIIKITQKSSLIPEPLRLAHMIASAVMTGESKRE